MVSRLKKKRRIAPETIDHIKVRDKGCVAALWLGAADGCRDRWGNPSSPLDPACWEFQHINDFDLGQSVGTPDRVCILCSWHHQYSRVWLSTSHGPELRLYAQLAESGVAAAKAGKMAVADAAKYRKTLP